MRLLLRQVAVALFILSAAFLVTAQDDPSKANEKPEFFFKDGRQTIEVSFPRTPPHDFISRHSKDPNTYKLYQVETPDLDRPCVYQRCINEWTGFLAPGRNPECLDDGCGKLNLYLSAALPADKNYILVVNYLLDGKPAKIAFSGEPKLEVVDPFSADDVGKGFVVKANVPLTPAPELNVERTVYRVRGDNPQMLRAIEEKENLTAKLDGLSSAQTGRLSYKFEKRLREGMEYSVSTAGIKDDLMKPLTAKGTLKTPGTPAAPAAPKITGTFGLTSAAGQKSVLELSGSFTPLHDVSVGDTLVFWEPSLVVDLGLRSTKSNNSVTLALPFTRTYHVKDLKDVPSPTPPRIKTRDAQARPQDEKSRDEKSIAVENYARWKNTPWGFLENVKVYLGPKAEFDRQFRRKNLLGNARLDFNFHRFIGTIADKRSRITDEGFGIGAEKGKSLEGINFGFKLVPYVSLDFGGHVNNETVSKDTASVFVPRHRIFRSYAGFTGIIEWRVRDLPMSLNFDESFVHMAATEQIGYSNDDGVFLRRVRGFHPHLKTSIDLGFDPAKHYSLTFEYENGRLAPNFEYLNKFTTGIKVTY
ncbi:MAG TPA: hypothetical protein VF538_12095 [Pyrinomonadaceae bacterium]|jgi:hypothetical protein